MQRREVKSAVRTFEVLELFAERRSALHLNEIYTALGYPQSSTTNLLKSMVIMGYLNYNRAKRTYLPTLRINALGSWIPGYIQKEGGYRELVRELQRRTDETVALATQNDLYIQYLFIEQPTHEYKLVPASGAMRLMVASTAGHAMLSRMRDRDINKLYRYTNYYELIQPRVDIAVLMREIEWVRHTGYSYIANAPWPETSSIAFALNADLDGIPLAIGVGGLADRIHRNRSDIVRITREVIAEFDASRPAPLIDPGDDHDDHDDHDELVGEDELVGDDDSVQERVVR